MIYKKIIKPVLFLFEPEAVHNFFLNMGKFLGSFQLGRFFISAIYGYRGKNISKTIDGIYYKTPILLSAGFDYNANLIDILSSMSFGGVEIGSITARPCAGNPETRLRRLPNTQSILVNKGLRNDGVDKIIERIKNKKTNDLVVGISIARTNDKTTVSTEDGIGDYIISLKKIVEAGVGDYYTINISCPNSFGGEAFTTTDLLEQLLTAIEKVAYTKPMYIKMPISISNTEFMELLKVINNHRINGVIIGNLQKDYTKIDSRDFTPEKYSGGLSGKPCEERSNELITMTRKQYQKRFTIMGCGGIFSYQDAKDKFENGADLVQLITGMIYEGPGLIKNICRGLVEK